MNRRKIVLAVLFLALLSAGGFALLSDRKEKRDYHEVTSNIQSPWLNNDSLYFYSGSFFAKYSLGGDSVTRLSDYLFIQNTPVGVSWAPGAVVFQSNPSGDDRDDLSTAAASLGVNPGLPHWWRYDFNSKQYQLLYYSNIDDCTALFQIINTSFIACVKPQESGLNSYELDLFDNTQKTSKKLFAADDPISDVKSDGKNIFFVVTDLQGRQVLRSVGLGGGAGHEVYGSEGALSYAVSKNNNILINETPLVKQGGGGEDNDSPLEVQEHKIVLLAGGQKAVDKSIKSLPVTVYSQSERLLASSLDGSIRSVESSGTKELAPPTKDPLESGDWLFNNGDGLYVLKAEGALLSTKARGNNYKKPSGFNTAKDNDPKGDSFINKDGGDIYSVYLYGQESSSKQQEAIGARLESIGFRASEFNFRWVVDGPGFHVPISPAAVILK